MEFTLTGEPRSTNNIYRYVCMGNFPRMYMSAIGKALKGDYQWQLKSQYKGKPRTDDIDLRVELFFSRKGKHDVDNFNKLLLDACTGILWEDDSQIVSLLIVKNFDKKSPRIEISL